MSSLSLIEATMPCQVLLSLAEEDEGQRVEEEDANAEGKEMREIELFSLKNGRTFMKYRI